MRWVAKDGRRRCLNAVRHFAQVVPSKLTEFQEGGEGGRTCRALSLARMAATPQATRVMETEGAIEAPSVLRRCARAKTFQIGALTPGRGVSRVAPSPWGMSAWLPGGPRGQKSISCPDARKACGAAVRRLRCPGALCHSMHCFRRVVSTSRPACAWPCWPGAPAEACQPLACAGCQPPTDPRPFYSQTRSYLRDGRHLRWLSPRLRKAGWDRGGEAGGREKKGQGASRDREND